MPKSPLAAVAGTTGQAGRGIVRALHARGLPVRALVRKSSRLGNIAALCTETRTREFTDAKTLAGALGGADYLLSAVGNTKQPDRIARRRVDVDANLYLFSEAKRAGVRRIAFVSVFGASLESPSSLARLKGEAEKGLKECGVPFVITQPTGYFSDLWDMLQQSARFGVFWTFGKLNVHMNPIHPDDLGEFVVRALLDDTKEGQSLPVGGPDTYDLEQLRQLCEQALDRKLPPRRVPLWLVHAALGVMRPVAYNSWEVAQSMVAAMSGPNVVGEAFGDRHLLDYFRERLAAASP